MNNTIILNSELDQSTNVVNPNGFESRYVQRANGKEVIIYLSSHQGCDRACRMCHLTQTGQTRMTPASQYDFAAQASEALRLGVDRHSGEPAEVIHFNFMARGEPILNPEVINNFDELAEILTQSVREIPFWDGVKNIKFKISTIMSEIYEHGPNGEVTGGMTELPFKKVKPDIYYSLYSLNQDFRRRWLSKAEEPREMLRILSNYKAQGGTVVIHGAFINGENDEMEDVGEMVRVCTGYGLKRFNIVRFNTPDATKWRETDEYYILGIKDYMEKKGMTVQMVDKVGFDVAASCGMFIDLKKG